MSEERGHRKPGFTEVFPWPAFLLLALLAGLFLFVAPMFSRASHREALETASRANLHSWGTAIHAYREMRGKYPESLDALLKEGFVDDPQMLIDPLDRDAGMPGGTNYGYVGPLPADAPSDIIIVYSRTNANPTERAVLYNDPDRSVEWVNVAELHGGPEAGRRSLQNSYSKLIALYGDKLTEERRAELKRFYEIPK